MAFWEAQRGATKLPAVGFATTTDIEQMVHEPNKTEVARRLVLEMNRLAQTPTRKPPLGPSHGPALQSAVKAAGGLVTLTFDNSSKDMQVTLHRPGNLFSYRNFKVVLTLCAHSDGLRSLAFGIPVCDGAGVARLFCL